MTKKVSWWYNCYSLTHQCERSLRWLVILIYRQTNKPENTPPSTPQNHGDGAHDAPDFCFRPEHQTTISPHEHTIHSSLCQLNYDFHTVRFFLRRKKLTKGYFYVNEERKNSRRHNENLTEKLLLRINVNFAKYFLHLSYSSSFSTR